jgi:hypothetical protein
MNYILFNKDSLSVFLKNRLILLRKHIEDIPLDKFFEANLERLVKESEKKFWLKLPELSGKAPSVSPSEISITNGDFGRNIPDKATKFTVTISFTGDQDLFLYEPPQSDTNKPEIEKMLPNSIILTIIEHNPIATEVSEKITALIEKIKLFLSWVKDTVDTFKPLSPTGENDDVTGFNELVTAIAKNEIAKRQSQLKASKNIAQDIENLLNQNQ